MHRLSKLVFNAVQYGSKRRATNSSSILTIEDMPHPKELPIFGTKLSLLAAGSGSKLHEYVNNRHKHLGPIFYERLGGNTKLVFISDPNLMKTLFLSLEGKYPAHILPEPWVLYEKLYGAKRGLFFMDNEEWFINRRLMNRHLLKEDSEHWLIHPIKATIQNFVDNWKRKAENGTFVPDIESDLYKLSTDVIINILMGEECMTANDSYRELLDIFSESVKKIFETTTQLYGLPVAWYQRFNLKPWQNFKECVDNSIFISQKIVQEMLTRKESNNGLVKKLCQENMREDTITRIVADFVIAAGDTTAYTTLWTLFLLSNNDLEQNEILKRGQAYVKLVVKESMRLYPVAPFLTRILPKDSMMGRYKLNRGTPIIASIYTSGHDENNFSQAHKFAPYRWDRNDSKKISLLNHVPSASLPFAMGARSCIGKKIAMLQLSEVISQIVHNFEVTCDNANEVKAITSQVLVPNQDIKLRLTLREGLQKKKQIDQE